MVPVRRHARDWRAYLAGGGLVLVVLSLINHCKKYFDKERENADNQSPAPGEDQKPSGNVFNPVSTRESKPEEAVSNKTRHKAHERHFWRRQLRTAYCLNWITAVGALITSLGLVFVGLGLIISKEAADAARHAAEEAKRQSALTFAQTRPWIVINPTIDGPVKIQDSQTFFNIGFDMKNVGHSPAFDLQLWYEIRPFFIIPYRKDIASPDFCNVVHKVSNLGFGHWMPPESEYRIHRTTISVDSSLVIKAFKQDSGNLSRFQTLVIGCVIYRIDGDAILHQTPFVYRLYRWTAEHPTGITLFKYEVGAEFSADSLRLQEEEQAKGPEPD